MFQQSIKRKIVGIAVGLIVLMLITSFLSMVMAARVGRLLDEQAIKYIPAYDHLANMNALTLQRALAIRRMVIAKMELPSDEAAYAARLRDFQQIGPRIDQEAAASRKLINSIIDDASTPSDNAALARIDTRIDVATNDLRRRMNEENDQLIPYLDARNFDEARRSLARADLLRDEFNQRISAIRTDMLNQVFASTSTVIHDQQRAIYISAIVSVLAAAIGMIVAILVSSGISRSIRILLEGTRNVEAGYFDRSITVTTRDEIGQLSAAFNRMIEQLRDNERIRQTFGKYIDPQVVKGLIDQPDRVATEGQRRIMTVLFCDMKGFTALSEGVTPRGLVKVMNRYLSIMSEPIRIHQGVIDKYIGDSIMAYWGPPFVEEADESAFACLAAIDMTERIETLRKDLPELLGVRNISIEFDIRIGIATGEALVGSIGSEFMMSYTLMGDMVNLASRLESANKAYGCRSLISETTAHAAAAIIETREIDRVVVVGQTQSQGVFEILGRKGDLTPSQISLRTSYSKGLAEYRERRWVEARLAFNAALEAAPGDGPSLTMLNRVEALQRNSPSDWDGTWHLDSK